MFIYFSPTAYLFPPQILRNRSPYWPPRVVTLIWTQERFPEVELRGSFKQQIGLLCPIRSSNHGCRPTFFLLLFRSVEKWFWDGICTGNNYTVLNLCPSKGSHTFWNTRRFFSQIFYANVWAGVKFLSKTLFPPQSTWVSCHLLSKF